MKIQNQQNVIDSHSQKLEQVQPLLDYVNAQKQDLSKLKKLKNKIKTSEDSEYSRFRSILPREAIQVISDRAKSKNITLEEELIKIIEDNMDGLRDK